MHSPSWTDFTHRTDLWFQYSVCRQACLKVMGSNLQTALGNLANESGRPTSAIKQILSNVHALNWKTERLYRLRLCFQSPCDLRTSWESSSLDPKYKCIDGFSPLCMDYLSYLDGILGWRFPSITLQIWTKSMLGWVDLWLAVVKWRSKAFCHLLAVSRIGLRSHTGSPGLHVRGVCSYPYCD